MKWKYLGFFQLSLSISAETERSADEASGSEYEVDFIISKRTSPGGSVEYQVRWKGKQI